MSETPERQGAELSFLERFPEDLRGPFAEAWARCLEVVSLSDGDADARSRLMDAVEPIATLLASPSALITDFDGRSLPLVELSAEFRRKMVEELRGNLSPEKIRAFNLDDIFFLIYRDDRTNWASLDVQLTEDRLVIDGFQVMDRFELPIMNDMVDGSIRLFRGRGVPRVLEIGWGMGFSGSRFLAAGVDYTVIEAHSVIAKNARQACEGRGRVIESLWQKAPLEGAQFDIVFFDAFGASFAGEADYFDSIVKFGFPMLAEGGVFTLFLNNGPSFVKRYLDAGFREVVCTRTSGITVPHDCTYLHRDTKSWLNVFAIK